jgi:hypothetical protein
VKAATALWLFLWRSIRSFIRESSLLSQKAGADLEREKKAESHEEDRRRKRIFEKK